MGKRKGRPWVVQLLLDIALAPAAFFLIQAFTSVSTATALLVSILLGAAWTGFGVARTGKVNAVSLCVLLGLAVGVALTVVTGDPRFGVAKDSLYTGVFGVVTLASMLAPRPLMFYLIRPFATEDGDPAKVEEWNRSWLSPLFRRCMRVMTAVWGIGLLVEALGRIAIVYGGASLDLAAALSPVLTAVVLIALMSWTAGYGRRAGEARRQIEQGA
ncbi:VC0807 family protein [Kutzneria buriramensis]|uniref:Intracellular septation protein A n=1 Tax=Kutzneria buriramensis TaxID=1045776 RepID=A0A3E0HAU4_9PSEU|nr:VC0807 family protein [Kutzneria buriramensis]REH41169.1 hypothetical protein BCF44_112251 [Kutzneria buriramensis]